jgi:hypothetical protein
MCFHIVAGQQLVTEKHHAPLFAIYSPDDIWLPLKRHSPFGDARAGKGAVLFNKYARRGLVDRRRWC